MVELNSFMVIILAGYMHYVERYLHGHGAVHESNFNTQWNVAPSDPVSLYTNKSGM